MTRLTVAAATVLTALTACGGEDPGVTPAGPVPELLRGIWQTRAGDDVWTLKFLATGGEGNGPSVFLSGGRAGELAGPISLSGGRITLEFEPTCKKYRFEVTTRAGREKLFLQPDDRFGGCPATEVGTVLAAGGWARPGAPAPEDEWPLERIRDEGSLQDETVMEHGLVAREYVVCDGPPSACEHDPPLREPYQHVALEVSRGGGSALFGMAPDAHGRVAAFGETSVFAMDDPDRRWNPDGLRYRLLRPDGTEVPLELVMDPVPAVPGPGVLVVDYAAGEAEPQAVQHAFLVDEHEGTLRPLDVPRNADLGYAGRYWGPNTDEFLWFAYADCRVHWVEGGRLEGRRLDCADDFEFGWDGGDFTYAHHDWFPDGWLQPGRMALLERLDDRRILHVSLDRGATWRRVRVSSEAAVPEALRRLG